MKKFIAIFIFIITIFSFTTFANENKTITFRNLDWNTPISTFIDNIETDYEWYPGNIEVPTDGDYNTTASTSYSYTYYNPSNYKTTYIPYDKYHYAPAREFSTMKNINVAGYESGYTHLFFMQPVNKDGTVDHDPLNAKFYMGTYTIFDNIDRVSVFNDLSKKLSSLYGDCYYEKYNENTGMIRVWKDDNNNIVVLEASGLKYESLDSIDICYMSGTAMKDLQILDEALYNESCEIDIQIRADNSDNTDGL